MVRTFDPMTAPLRPAGTRTPWTLPLVLVLLVLALYGRTVRFPFTDWDDPQYIETNAVLKAAAEGQLAPLWTEPVMGNHHPVTMASYALEQALFGTDPQVMHATNVVLHAVNVLLAYLLVLGLAGNAGVAGAAAALFAVHPMHAENVAWLSARKDLLMLAFGLAGVLAWHAWRRRAGAWRYATALLLFALACGSKAMAVAFVPALLLLDLHGGRSWRARSTWLPLLPFVALALATGLMAIQAQAALGVINNAPREGFERLLIGWANLGIYTLQQLAPVGLNAFHAYPPAGALPAGYPLAALLGLALVAGVLWSWRTGPGLITLGLAWMVVHLLLVLQWLPVGEAIRADRYTYAAGVGFSLALAAALHRVRMRPLRNALLGLWIGGFVLLAWPRIAVWSSPVAVWTDMIGGRPKHYPFYMDRAVSLAAEGDTAAALRDHDRAIALAGGRDLRPRFERGMFRIRQRAYREAMPDLIAVFRVKPDHPGLLPNMIYAELKLGLCTDVVGNATAALRMDSANADLLNMRAWCLLELGRAAEAGADIERSRRVRDGYGELGVLQARWMLARGDTATACAALADAARLTFTDPDMRQWRERTAAALCR